MKKPVKTIKFTVDAKLLEELGERLVGKPYVALAELIKNSYDADATKVTIKLDDQNDSITIEDNGHGMNKTEFTNFWMRIGSRHKERQKFSTGFKRPITGSKGVGRLAVQLLANNLLLETVSKKDKTKKIISRVDWKKAINQGELTNAEAEYETKKSKEGFKPGTKITLNGLKQKWDDEKIGGLATQIWVLQPPFGGKSLGKKEQRIAFDIDLESPNKELEKEFKDKINAIRGIWHARIVGENKKGRVKIHFEFRGGEPKTWEFRIPHAALEGGNFDIRVYKLQGKQPEGILVDDARDYLRTHGGVHVYDTGFHLPQYGSGPEEDWLGLEMQHAHRLSKSQLLPDNMQKDFEHPLNNIPTLTRVLGVVNVNTSKETDLDILVTRDRLKDTQAFQDLKLICQTAMHFYAVEETRRKNRVRARWGEIKKKDEEFKRVEEVLEKHKSQIPKKVYEEVHENIERVMDKIGTESKAVTKRLSLMGALATAGISSLAVQHELKRQFKGIRDITVQIDQLNIKDKEERARLQNLKRKLTDWLHRAEAVNNLFAYVTDESNRGKASRSRALSVVKELVGQLGPVMEGATIHTDRLDKDILLPKATMAEWGSIFQNVFLNAFNAMLSSKKKIIDVSSRREGKSREIVIQDTGCGLELKNSEKLFELFERGAELSSARRDLGYGGGGMGLTIVRFIARNIGCKVAFVEPEDGFKTAFSIKWEEI
ncbi:ATP-binding protein [archaeon]